MQMTKATSTRPGRTLALLLIFVLAACGGGGGGGGEGGGTPPPLATTLSADIYPLASGDRRSWRAVNGGAAAPLRHERIGEAVTVGGGTALQALSGAGDVEDTEYLQRSASGIRSVPGPGSDPLTAAIGAVETLRFGIGLGQTVVLAERSNVSVDVDGDGRADSLDLRIESSFVAKEALTTTLGSFADSSHVRTVTRLTLRLTGASGGQSVVQTDDSWYVPGLGPIKTNSTTTSNGSSVDNTSEELVAYGIGTQRNPATPAGLSTPTPAAGAALGPDSPIDLEFSAAIDPLSLRGAGGLLLRDGAGQVVATTITSSADLKRVSVRPKNRLPDQLYELRSGGTVSDLGGNPLPASLLSVYVDTMAPRLVSSSPANGALDASTTEALRLRFDEPVRGPSNGQLRVRLNGPTSTDYLTATIQGNELTATLPAPLQRNAQYSMELYDGLVDAAGNAVAYFFVGFRTDSGPLARPVALASDASVNALTLADIDGDGRQDLIFVAQQIGTFSKYVGLRRQQADGRYAEAVKLYELGETQLFDIVSLVAIDADGDGLLDLALYGQSGMTLLRQLPGLTFAAEKVPVNLASWQVQGSDLNGGGRGTLAVVEPGRFNFLRRDGAGAWSSVAQLASGSDFVGGWRLVDLNGDGLADLVWLRMSASAPGTLELAWALRQGTGFAAERSRPLSLAPATGPALAVGDLNGDGRPDVVLLATLAADPASRVLLLRQQADGGFAEPVALSSGYGPSAAIIGDLDGDGRADLIVGHDTASKVGVYLQAADGTLQPERLFESSHAYYGPNQLALVDLNADGRRDIVAKSDVLLGRGFSGSWPLAAPPTEATRAKAAAAKAPAATQAATATATATAKASAGPLRRLIDRLTPAAAAGSQH